jgi:hypothetical protein
MSRFKRFSVTVVIGKRAKCDAYHLDCQTFNAASSFLLSGKIKPSRSLEI